jgi:thioredoxin reductase (NADPH)
LIYDIVIIGAGPAGLTAAMYALRARMAVLVIECPSVISQAIYALTVENFPGFPDGINGSEFITNLKKQVNSLGGSILSSDIKSIERHAPGDQDTFHVRTEKAQYDALSVIIATGASAKRLNSQGEERFLGKGVSYCAACDGMFFKDRHIAVVGGGDSALEEALFLTRFAKRIFLIHRRDKLRAVKLLQDRVFSNAKIDIVWNSVIDEILGDNKMLGLRVKNKSTGISADLDCQGLFVSIGKTPNTGFLQGMVGLDSQGYIITDKALETSEKGIFACGDCRDTLFRQIITACGDGALASEICRKYIDAKKGL